MPIPYFLKKEYKVELSSVQEEFIELSNKYMDYFGTDFSTEPFDYSYEEWNKMIKYCLENNVHMELLTGRELT